jgi:ribosomal protein L12E/L44/L45/RPP1/RPP2
VDIAVEAGNVADGGAVEHCRTVQYGSRGSEEEEEEEEEEEQDEVEDAGGPRW